MSKKSRERHQKLQDYFGELKETSALVDPFVKEYLDGHILLSAELKQKVMGRFRCGKAKLRPAQVRFSYELFGKNDWQKIIPACAAIEVKDTGYYCADDVFDKWCDSEEGYIMGNMLSTMANGMMCELATLTSREVFQQIMRCFFRLDGDIYQGFYLDTKMRETDEGYYMCKAYAYNYWEHILRIGALLGGANEQEVVRIGEFGKNVGIAYTIANDTCDFGKPNLEDFCSGKATLPILYTLRNVNGSNKEKFQSLMGKGTLTEEEKDVVRKIVVKTGAIRYGKQKALELCGIAKNILETFPSSKARDMLDFSMTMTQRNKFYEVLKKYE